MLLLSVVHEKFVDDKEDMLVKDVTLLFIFVFEFLFSTLELDLLKASLFDLLFLLGFSDCRFLSKVIGSLLCSMKNHGSM